MKYFIILILQKKAVVKHWPRPGVDPTMVTDYLCLQSRHNNLSKTLAEYIDMKFKMKLML